MYPRIQTQMRKVNYRCANEKKKKKRNLVANQYFIIKAIYIVPIILSDDLLLVGNGLR
jgi:hypothetical protein